MAEEEAKKKFSASPPRLGYFWYGNRSGRELVMLLLGVMEPRETRGAEMEQAHHAVLTHTQW